MRVKVSGRKIDSGGETKSVIEIDVPIAKLRNKIVVRSKR